MPISRAALEDFPPGGNIGLNHSLSGTAAFDLDHALAETALLAVGIDLTALLAGNPYKNPGQPRQTAKTRLAHSWYPP